MTFSRDSFDLLSFDCYGTLVDWEAGIWQAVQELGFKQGQFEPSQREVLMAFAQLEAEIEKEANTGKFLSYREILQWVYGRMSSSWGWPKSASICAGFAESVKDWPVFEDTVESLRALARDFPLYILSNIDADLIQFDSEEAWSGFCWGFYRRRPAVIQTGPTAF